MVGSVQAYGEIAACRDNIEPTVRKNKVGIRPKNV